MSLTLPILYHDDSIVVINKPANWFVHRTWLDRHEKTVVLQILRDQINQYLYPVHRLDRPTSGVLVFALTKEAAHHLSQQFNINSVTKLYHAVVRGYVENRECINYPLTFEHDKIADQFADNDKKPQEAITYYRGICTTEQPFATGPYPTSRYSLVEVHPLTGRKHQIRRHLKHVSHPIIGDTTHGDLQHNRTIQTYFKCYRLMLHASYLEISHPTKEMPICFYAPWDEAWLNLLNAFKWPTTPPDFNRLV